MSNRSEKDFTNEVCRPVSLPGGEHGVLIIHGFTGSPAQMRPLADRLNAQGFTVESICLPGHATTMDDMADKTWQDWLDAAKEAFLALKKRCKYVSVTGLSMGGCLTLILAEQMEVTAIAPLSAPMGTQTPLWPARVMSMVMPTIWWKPRVEGVLDERYDYGYPGFRTRCGIQLNRIIKLARHNLHAVTCPTLVVQSHGDETIAADSADIILQGVSAKRKGVLWLDSVPHNITLSKEIDRIADAVGRHFREAE